jgi:hypothetical protein
MLLFRVSFPKHFVVKHRQSSFAAPVTASGCPIGRSTDACHRNFGPLLALSIHSTQKAAQVSRQCDDGYGHSLDRQAISG